jgi:zinc protease
MTILPRPARAAAAALVAPCLARPGAPAGAQRPAAPVRSAAAPALRIPNEHYTLPNGLHVVLAPDHSTPQVTVDVWYHVGSKNEVAGRTGFAHMFEHVMFTGSGHVPYGLHDRLTEGVGGNNNGSTNQDRTNYYETVPSNYLESALWLEADRMGFLLDKLDSAKFVAQRDIVQNERRQGVDNQPYGRAFEILTSAQYPESNPYSWPVVGYIADLQRASVEDVKQFFRLYYAPSNATLAIVGDFDPAQARAWVARYFGDLPRGGAITRPAGARPPTLAAEKRLVYEDRVQVPRLYLRWPTVGAREPDRYALTALAAVLTASRTSRLTKALVYDRQSASSAFANQSTFEASGDFNIQITPRPGHTLAELEATADSVLDRLRRDGPTDEEMAKAKAGIEFAFVAGLESTLGKAETLNTGAVYFGDPDYYARQYAMQRAVTAADVKRVANRYLGPGRVVLSVVPLGKPEQASRPEASLRVVVSPDGGHYTFQPSQTQ